MTKDSIAYNTFACSITSNISLGIGHGILIQLALLNHQHIVPRHKAIDFIWLEHPHPTPPI